MGPRPPILALAVVALWLTMLAISAVWVVRDCRARGVDPLPWVAAIVVANVFGIAAYAIMRIATRTASR